MEDKRRQFDASLAKVGDVVESRLGRKVRIICLDKKSSSFPVVGLEEDDLIGTEAVRTYTKQGWNDPIEGSNEDLFFPLEEHEFYMNIYKRVYPNGHEEYNGGFQFWKTKENAIRDGKDVPEYVTTIKVNFKA